MGNSDKADCRKEVLGVRIEEEGVKEAVTFQFFSRILGIHLLL